MHKISDHGHDGPIPPALPISLEDSRWSYWENATDHPTFPGPAIMRSLHRRLLHAREQYLILRSRNLPFLAGRETMTQRATPWGLIQATLQLSGDASASEITWRLVMPAEGVALPTVRELAWGAEPFRAALVLGGGLGLWIAFGVLALMSGAGGPVWGWAVVCGCLLAGAGGMTLAQMKARTRLRASTVDLDLSGLSGPRRQALAAVARLAGPGTGKNADRQDDEVEEGVLRAARSLAVATDERCAAVTRLMDTVERARRAAAGTDVEIETAAACAVVLDLVGAPASVVGAAAGELDALIPALEQRRTEFFPPATPTGGEADSDEESEDLESGSRLEQVVRPALETIRRIVDSGAGP